MTILVLWVRSCTASQRGNGDHSTLSRLTDNLYRARLNDRFTRDKKEMIGKSPLGKRLADKYENPSLGKMRPKEFQKMELSKRSEPSCIKEKRRESVTCDDGSSQYILKAVCRVSSLNACHNSVPIYRYKKCNAVLTFYPGCGSHTTDCVCAN